MVFQVAFFNRNRRQKPNQESTDILVGPHELMVQSASQAHEKRCAEKVRQFKLGTTRVSNWK